MKLVKDSRDAWRWYSTQALLVLAAIPHVWIELPPELKATVPEDWMRWIITAVAVGGIVGRVISQEREQ